MKNFLKTRYSKDFFLYQNFFVSRRKRNNVKVQNSSKNIYWLNTGIDSSNYMEDSKALLNMELSFEEKELLVSKKKGKKGDNVLSLVLKK